MAHATEQQRYQEASSLFDQGQYAAALAILNTLLQSHPDSPQLLKAKTRCLEAITPSKSPKSPKAWLPWGIGAGIATALLSLFGGYYAIKGNDTDLDQAALDALSKPQITAIASSNPDHTSHFNSSQTSNTASQYQYDPIPTEGAGIACDGRVDLASEIKRIEQEILQGKGVPPVLDSSNPNHKKWHRSSYQDIIDAAREARLNHGNPYLGETVNLPETETIHLPGNITGQDTLTIRYIEDFFVGDIVLGDDEDIVYLLGATIFANITEIHPGTIILNAAFQNDRWDGAMTPEMINELVVHYKNNTIGHGGYLVAHNLSREKYKKRLGEPAFQKLIARGTEEEPILICSDAEEPTPYDYFAFHFGEGIQDYLILSDCNLHLVESGNTISSRCKFENFSEISRTGTGHIIGCYFGDTCNENMVHGKNEMTVVMYNIFNNSRSNSMVIVGDWMPRIQYNVFSSKGTAIDILSQRGSQGIIENNFINGGNYYLGGLVGLYIELPPNYFDLSTTELEERTMLHKGTDEETMASIRDMNDNEIDYRNRLIVPIPLPFKTGISEIDNN